MFNDDSLAGHERMLAQLMKKRERAFLWGRNSKMIKLDRRIAELEMELDALIATTSTKLTK